MTRVRFVASDDWGGGHLRSYWPADELTRRGHQAKADVLYPRSSEYDVVVVHRPLTMDRWGRVSRYRDAGVTVVVDEDDDLGSVPDSNYRFQRLWSEDRRRMHDAAIAEADHLTVATPRLAEVYGDLASSVWLCRNALPSWIGELPRPQPGPVPRVGWTGIILTHRHDLEWLAPEAPRALQGAQLVTVGSAETAYLLGIDVLQVEHHPPRPMPEMYAIMASVDIGMVPLLPGPFNEAKSWLKALEFLTVGTPVVATDLPEQRELIHHGIEGFLAATPADFADYVQLLVHDPQLRVEMGEAARARGRELSIERTGECWEGFLMAGSRPVSMGADASEV
jgi:glycosyltransferase involved in cell wall biosynthesis